MSDDLKLIKQRIHEDENIKVLLEELGCTTINDKQNLITAQLPPQFDSSNRRSIEIKKNESLSGHIWSRGISGDIYTVVAYILYDSVTKDEFYDSLTDTKRWICDTLGYDEFLSYDPSKKSKPKDDLNGWLKKIKRQRSREIVITENRSYDESMLKQYHIQPVEWWMDEGIGYETQLEFQIGFDLFSKRIIFPIHNKDGKIIGVKGRYVGDNKRFLDDMKYLYLLPCNKSVELFNLHRALPYIKERKEVIIVEGAKTTMKLWQCGFRNAVSIEGDSLTPAQMKILKGLGLDIHFIFAWDKGKDKRFIEEQIQGFRFRNCSYIYDEDDLLEEKESPTDKGEEVWEQLYTENINQFSNN